METVNDMIRVTNSRNRIVMINLIMDNISYFFFLCIVESSPQSILNMINPQNKIKTKG